MEEKDNNENPFLNKLETLSDLKLRISSIVSTLLNDALCQADEDKSKKQLNNLINTLTEELSERVCQEIKTERWIQLQILFPLIEIPEEFNIKDVLTCIYSFLYNLQNKSFTLKLQKCLMNSFLPTSMNQHNRLNEDEEGFVTSESEVLSNEDISDDLFRQLCHIQQRDSSSNDKKISQNDQIKLLIEEQQKQIAELKGKVSNREDILSEVTYGYMKDVTHWRELFSRKDRDSQNCFEVNYFEPTIILDIKTRELLNTKLNNIKDQCEQKIGEIYKKAKYLAEELIKVSYKLSALMNDKDPPSVMKSLFALESNPYKIWKLLQDQAGNRYFFKVFELQRPEYGIKYKEIDSLIAQSNGSGRQFEQYKSDVKIQMDRLIESTKSQIQSMREEVEEKEIEIEKIQSQFGKELENARKGIIKQMEEKFAVKKQQIKAHEREKFIKEIGGADTGQLLLQSSFQKWQLMAKIISLKDDPSQQPELLTNFLLKSMKKFSEQLGQLSQLQKMCLDQNKGKLSRLKSQFSRKQSRSSNFNLSDNMSSSNNSLLMSSHALKWIEQENMQIIEEKQQSIEVVEQKEVKITEKIQEVFKIVEPPKVEIKQPKIVSESENEKEEEEDVEFSESYSSEEDSKESNQDSEVEEYSINVSNKKDNKTEKLPKSQNCQKRKSSHLTIIRKKSEESLKFKEWKSGMQENNELLSKQVTRMGLELQQQREFNSSLKDSIRLIKLKLQLYEETFSDITSIIGKKNIKIEEIKKMNIQKLCLLQVTYNLTSKHQQLKIVVSGHSEKLKFALDMQKTKSDAMGFMIEKKNAEKSTLTKIFGLKESLAALEKESFKIEGEIGDVVDLNAQNVEIHRSFSNKEIQTDQVEIDCAPLLGEYQEKSKSQEKSFRKSKNIATEEDEKRVQKFIPQHISSTAPKKVQQIISKQKESNGQVPIKHVGNISFEKKQPNQVWSRLFNDQYERKEKELEMKKKNEMMEETKWEEQLKILDLYQDPKSSIQNEDIYPFLLNYAKKKAQNEASVNKNTEKVPKKRSLTPNPNESITTGIIVLQNSFSNNGNSMEGKQYQTNKILRSRCKPKEFNNRFNSSTGLRKQSQDGVRLNTEPTQNISKTEQFDYFTKLYQNSKQKQDSCNQSKRVSIMKSPFESRYTSTRGSVTAISKGDIYDQHTKFKTELQNDIKSRSSQERQKSFQKAMATQSPGNQFYMKTKLSYMPRQKSIDVNINLQQ